MKIIMSRWFQEKHWHWFMWIHEPYDVDEMWCCYWWMFSRWNECSPTQNHELYTREKRNTLHIAERLIRRGERDTGSNLVRRIDFFRSVALLTIVFLNSFYLSSEYPVEMSTATEVIEYADSEYGILFSGNSYFKTLPRWYVFWSHTIPSCYS